MVFLRGVSCEGDSFEWLVLGALGNQAQRLLGLVEGAFLFAAKHVVAKDAEEIGNYENVDHSDQNAPIPKFLLLTNASLIAEFVEVIFDVVKEATAGSEIGNSATLWEGRVDFDKLAEKPVCFRIKDGRYERDGLLHIMKVAFTSLPMLKRVIFFKRQI